MDVSLIECSLIDVLKDGKHRNFSKDFAIKLADSVRTEGMHQPIVVRPCQTNKGRYILVAGRHRLHAVYKVLKEQFIAANVDTDMDDRDAHMAMIAENLWRNPLTKAQHALCIQDWIKYYNQKHNEKTAEENKAVGGSDTVSSPAATTEEVAVPVTPPLDFTRMVAGATGQSEKSVKRQQKVATSFNAEQLECFDAQGVNQTDMLTIAKIKDQSERDAVVNLIAAGQSVEDSLKAVMKENTPTRQSSLGSVVQKAKDESKAEKAPDLTDDEWFETYCGEKSKMLTAGDGRYKRDAIAYRHILDARHNFRVKVKKVIAAECKKPGSRPVFVNLINRVIGASHPRDWLICGPCAGTGAINKDGGKLQCPQCFGAGYKVKLEEYL